MKTKLRVRSLFPVVLRALGGCAAAFPLMGLGATITVTVTNYGFSPPATTINVNDQVVWTWSVNDGLVPHTSTSDTNGLWDTGSHTQPFSSPPLTFASGGVFPYHCTFHVVIFNMKGTITVLAPPTVAITNPPNGAVFSAPASFTLAATAAAPVGTVTNVQFFQGAGSLGNTTTVPYAVPVNSLAAGDYTFSAVASDNGGRKATNAISVHVVTPVPVVLTGAQRLSASEFQFTYSANAGLNYVVLRSAALPGFTPIWTNMATNNPMTFLDTNANGAQNLYRVQLQPNP